MKNKTLADLRRRAEARLDKKYMIPRPVNEAEKKRLFHELQVHKIELEIQNNELVRARAEQDNLLRQSIAQFNDLYDFAPVGYLTLTSEGTIQRLNLSAAKLLGGEREKLINQRFGLFVSGEHLSAFGRFLEMVFINRHKEACELLLEEAELKPIWVQLEAVSTGEEECWVAMVDISGRKHMEQVLRARLRLLNFASGHSQGELLQEILDEIEMLTGSQIGFFHFVAPDEQTLLLQAWSTRTLRDMCTVDGTGRHYDIAEAGIWVDCVRERRPVIHNDIAALPASRRKGWPEGHANVSREMVVPVFRNGLIVAILGVGNKPEEYTSLDLEAATSLAGQTWEMIERKRIDEALRVSEEKYRMVANFTYDWEAWRSPESVFLYVSPSCLRVSGHRADEFLADADLFLRIVHPDDQPKIRAHYEEVDHDPLQKDQKLEFRIITTGGETRWISHYCTPVFAENGTWLGRRENNRDITQRKQDEIALQAAHDLLEQRVRERTAELEEANQALEIADRLKDEFLASMSHELRTPLTGILGLSEVMMLPGTGPLNEKQSRAFAQIHSSGQRMLELVNEILDLVSITAGKLSLGVQACSLAEICQASLSRISASAEKKKQSSSLSIEPEKVIIQADVHRLKQSLCYLLSNAVKFTPEGGRFGIQASASAAEQLVHITVWDEGIGIRAEDLPRLFQRFSQLDGRLSRTYGGVGVGLVLVKDLIELHGGTVTVESVFGQGSRFTINLPWQPEPAG